MAYRRAIITGAATLARQQAAPLPWWSRATAAAPACWSGNGAAAASISTTSSAASASAAAGAPPPPPVAAKGPLLEIREYWLHPAGVKDFLKLTAATAPLRRGLLPFLGMWVPDTGGELNRVVHLYAYESLAAREEMSAAAAASAEWQAYIDAARPHVQRQESRVMVEARALYAAVGAPGAAAFKAPTPAAAAASGSGAAAPRPALYELRQYQLHPGYGSVPKLLRAFEEGLPDKIAADADGKLVAFAHSDVGVLNQVVELWRYPSAAACVRAREAARAVPKWRDTIAAVTPGVQTFTTTFLTPCAFSPLQ